VGLEWGPFSLISAIEELLGRKNSGSILGIREYGSRDLSRSPCGTICPQKLALTSLTSYRRSVGIDGLRLLKMLRTKPHVHSRA
jgi:hypothetical protein